MPEINEISLKNDANLQGYWRLESDGTDSSTNSYNLTASGSPVHVSAQFGNGVDLESTSSQYYSIADASCPNLEISGSITVSAWIKIESLANWRKVVSKRDESAGGAYDLSVNASGNIEFYCGGLTTNIVGLSGVISVGNWYHVVGVYDSSAGKLKVFCNDVKNETNTSGTITDGNADFYIGCGENSGTPNNFFDGIVDDVAVFDRALSDSEVSSIYVAASSSKISLLKFIYG